MPQALAHEVIHWLLDILKPEDVVNAVRLGVGGVCVGATNAWTHWRTARSAKTVARALAAGFYYNFLERISSLSDAGTLRVRLNATTPDELTSVSPVTVVVMHPKVLSTEALRAAEQARGRDKATIVATPGQRDMTIFYERPENQGGLVIRDAPATYGALKRYMEDELRLKPSTRFWSKWRRTEKAVLKAYEKKVAELCGRGKGVAFALTWKACDATIAP